MFLNRLLPSFFPFVQMAFDLTIVEPAGKAQMKESNKDLFPTALFWEPTHSGQKLRETQFAEERHPNGHKARPAPTGLKGCL